MTRVVVVVLALLGAAGSAAGQAVEGWVVGRVIDVGTGEAIAGAEVRLTGRVERVASTGEDGFWRLGPLAAGRYTLSVEQVGFAPVERGIDVPAATDTLEIRLTPRPVSLEALVVTAGRRLQRLADATATTDLVTRREIRETGATDLASVLTERTGVALQGGHPAGSGVMIQGMGSERVLVLVDGQPFIGRISGAVDVSRIPTSMIERVEVVKGPRSTLYGSEAMGGVVNVITRRPVGSGWSASANVTGGDRGRLDVSGHAMGGVGQLTGVADVGRRSIELAPGIPGESGALAERWDAFGRASWRTPVDGLRVEAGGLLLDERQRWRSGQLFQFADNTQWSGRLGGVWERGPHRVTPAVYATSFDHHSRSGTSPEPVAGTGEQEKQQLLEAELLYAYDRGGLDVDAGLEVRREAIRSDRVVGADRSANTVESFVQTTLTWDRFTLAPGVRATWSDPWGTHWTPRLAALFRPIPGVALRLSTGEGFRAPDFKELYMEFLNVGPGFGYTVRGNPELEPEVSRNLTASIEWAGARTYLRLQAFENRFDDFIETRPVGDSSGITVFTYGNVDDGVTRGAELEAGATWRGFRLEGGYGVLQAEDSETGESLLGRPERSARGTIGYSRPGGLRVAVTGIYTGETAMRRTASGTEWREGFLRFDARLAQEVWGGFELAVGVDNLFDERPAEWPGFTGRHLYTAVSWRVSGDARGTR